MYKKYIKKRGRLTGPYYYESVRLKNKKIRSIYLGRDPNSAEFRSRVALLKTQDALPKGESIVIPIEPLRPRRPFKIKYELAALKELFGGVEKVTLPKVELAKEYAPEPGQNDFDFNAILFVLLAIVFVFGFFYLEATITTYSVADIINSKINYLPTLISIANLILLLLIYFSLRSTKI